MMVKESNHFKLNKNAFTVIRLDGEVPLANWQKVIIDEKEYSTVFHSGLDRFSMCIDGIHDLNGKQIIFI